MVQGITVDISGAPTPDVPLCIFIESTF